MRILITWGSKRGGTEGIAQMLGDELRQEGHRVDVVRPEEAARATEFDAVVVGGALYANRWHHAARRFVARREKALRSVPVGFFSGGPLDDSADRQVILPTRQVEILMGRVGAQGHMTFGGRLLSDARGCPASSMAKQRADDWRQPERVRCWALEIARALPTARPGFVIPQPGRSLVRLWLHGFVGWALCALTMAILLWATSLAAAFGLHALAVPLIFGIVALLELIVVAGLVQHSLALFRSVVGAWGPLALIFGVTWATGEMLSTLPWKRRIA